MINISEMMYDPDFCQQITVKRKAGAWKEGYWKESKETLQMTGVITTAGEQDLAMLPEADRISGAIAVRVAPPYQLYPTQQTSEHQGTSDVVIWRNKEYKVSAILPDDDWGFRKALCAML